LRKCGRISLVRVRNPWGGAVEWRGSWRDAAPEWEFIPEQERQRLGLVWQSDGEWWMSYQDWVGEFDQVTVCHLAPPARPAATWHGEWSGNTAGGCRNFLESFPCNPQYRLHHEGGGLLVSLTQLPASPVAELLSIGFVVYRLEGEHPDSETLGLDFFKHTLSAARSRAFLNAVEVCTRLVLPAGRYCIIPSTFRPGLETSFLLRVLIDTTQE